MGGELLVLRIALVGSCELHHLHLLELVLADDTAHVAAVGARLAAEARRVGAQRDGEPLGGQHFIAIQIGYGDLRRGG